MNDEADEASCASIRPAPPTDASLRRAIGWGVLVSSAPMAFGAFFNAPGLHVGRSVAEGVSVAAAIDLAALMLLRPLVRRRERACATSCAVFALLVPMLTVAAAVLVFGLAGG